MSIDAKNRKVALITGSTKGVGKQIAIDLLKKNYFVILNYAHSDAEAQNVREYLHEISENFIIVKADLSSVDGLTTLTDKVRQTTEKIDCLILNAGKTLKVDFQEISFDAWSKVLATNVDIPFFLIQKLSDLLSSGGRIIFIGSLLGIMPHGISIAYGVSKAAQHKLAQYLVKVFSDKEITVNVVAPGFIDTPWQKNKSVDHRRRIEEKISLKRFGKTEEVSQTCLHLIENGYINGQVIVVDGGYCYQ